MSGGVTAASSVKLGAAEEGGAELGLSHLSGSGDSPSPPQSRGDGEKPSLLWSLWRLCMWVRGRGARARRALSREPASARAGLAGSSGRKVTVRPGAPERGEEPSVEGLAGAGRVQCGPPSPARVLQERLSTQRWPVRAGTVARPCPHPVQGSHPSFCFHPDTVALEGGWDPVLFQSLP